MKLSMALLETRDVCKYFKKGTKAEVRAVVEVSLAVAPGEFVLLTTSWMVMPVRRFIPGLAGLDLSTLLLAWVIQAFGLWIEAAIRGVDLALVGLVLVALLDLVRYSLYILVAAVIIEVVFSWINPGTPVARRPSTARKRGLKTGVPAFSRQGQTEPLPQTGHPGMVTLQALGYRERRWVAALPNLSQDGWP